MTDPRATNTRLGLTLGLGVALMFAGLSSSCMRASTTEPATREGLEASAASGVLVDAALVNTERLDRLGTWVSDNLEDERYLVPVDDADLSFGDPNARVTFVVFADYQCPYCARLDQALMTLVQTYPTDIRVVFKQFPLEMHTRARSAARAMLAAHARGLGHAMHAMLFEHAGDLDDEELRAYADQVQISDLRGFWADVEQGRGDAQIQRDIALGLRVGVRSTPSFFINGVPHRGTKSFEELRELYTAELDVVDSLIAVGAVRSEIYAAFMHGAAEKREVAPRPKPSSSTRPRKPDPLEHYAVPVDGRPSTGPDDALVTIIEFADYECPYCRKVEPTLITLRQRYGADLRVVFRQQPLPMHASAQGAALAALAAHRQGEFWAMHTLLFNAAETRQLGDYEALARQLGLDLKQFRADMADPALASEVSADQAVARQFGATGTPAFFVNGRPLSGAQPVEVFEALIDTELAAAKAFESKRRVARGKLYATMSRDWEVEVKLPPIAEHHRHSVSVTDLPGAGKLNKPAIEVVGCVDFDCPYCARAAQMMDQVLTTKPYESKVAYYFAHFPLPMHETADGAHRAAIAAGEQGKFWDMHDLLFADRTRRGETEYVAMARELGLDVDRFLADWRSSTTADKIVDDQAMCVQLGVSGTPTYFVNGRRMRGAVPFEMAREVLDEELAGGFEAANTK